MDSSDIFTTVSIASWTILISCSGYTLQATLDCVCASAERTESKVKKRLSSTMTDDEYFSSLLLIASEKDLADKLSCDDIINRFASMSPVLRKHLVGA